MTATAETYNGWKNYETWCVNLWLANEEPLYDDIRRIVADETDDAEHGPSEDARYRIARRIREYAEDPDASGGAFAVSGMAAQDLIGHALDRVDWDAIAAAFTE